MRRGTYSKLIAVAVIAIAAWFYQGTRGLSWSNRKTLEKGERFILISLDPNWAPSALEDWALQNKKTSQTGEITSNDILQYLRGEPAAGAQPGSIALSTGGDTDNKTNRPQSLLKSAEEKAPPPEKFHNWTVLGKRQIDDPKERAELLGSLSQGIADYKGHMAACFNPRHGISATREGKTVELVICFECGWIQIYDDRGLAGVGLKGDAEVFHRALEKAGIPVKRKW